MVIFCLLIILQAKGVTKFEKLISEINKVKIKQSMNAVLEKEKLLKKTIISNRSNKSL